MTNTETLLAVGDSRKTKQAFWSQEWFVRSVTVAVFVLLFIGMHFWLTQGFFLGNSRVLNIHQNIPVLVLALAAVVGLLGGAFDLSIAGNATLAAFLTVGLTSVYGLPLPLVLLLVLLMGAAAGFLNGIIVTKIGVNVIIATLGMGSVLLGLSVVFGGGGSVTQVGGTPIPDWFLQMGAYTNKLPLWIQIVLFVLLALGAFVGLGRLQPKKLNRTAWGVIRAVIVLAVLGLLQLGINLFAWFESLSVLTGVFIVLVLVVWLFMDRTSWGRNIKATGSNPLAARLAGVRTSKETILAFMVTGVLSSLAGILLGASQGSASPNVAGGFLLPAFAAGFLSTVIFSAGRFTVLGTVVGGVFVAWVAQGLIEGGLKFTWTEFVNGAVLIIAVALSSILRRRSS